MSVNCRSSSFIFLISWLLYLLQFTLLCIAEKPCNLNKPFPEVCGKNATCEQTSGNDGFCQCLPTHHIVGGKCVLIPVPSHLSSRSSNDHDLSSSGSSTALWIVIPCILALAGAALFLVKRLKLVEKLYQFRVRRYNTVFVTSLQDDDAPIT